MAVRADLDLEVGAERGTRLEAVPAGAGHGDFRVLRVDAVFHDLASGRVQRRGRAV